MPAKPSPPAESRRSLSISPTRALLALLLALAATALLAQPAAGARRPLPDLAISAVTFPPQYAFKGEPASSITFCERTTNLGNAPTRRRLHNVMVLTGTGGIQRFVATRDVPRLPATRRRRGARPRHYSHYGCGRGEDTPLNLPLGAYEVQVCVDRRIRERNPNNSCYFRDKSFFVIKLSWTGTITGTGSFGFEDPGSETWRSTGATFTFNPAQATVGRYGYKMAGAVAYTDVGSGATGRDKRGAGTDFNPDGRLLLDYVNENYTAIGKTSAGFCPITNRCDVPTNGPANPVFLDSGVGTGKTRPLPFGTETIAGTFSERSDYKVDWSLP